MVKKQVFGEISTKKIMRVSIEHRSSVTVVCPVGFAFLDNYAQSPLC